jgi:hypothetical protein
MLSFYAFFLLCTCVIWTNTPFTHALTAPSKSPTTSKPSKSPTTSFPTPTPSRHPSVSKPSQSPTHHPSPAPSTSKPSQGPTFANPSQQPSRHPTNNPNHVTSKPSKKPSQKPVVQTTTKPTVSPGMDFFPPVSFPPSSSSSSVCPTTNCPIRYRHDGECDDQCNNVECVFDYGDCLNSNNYNSAIGNTVVIYLTPFIVGCAGILILFATAFYFKKTGKELRMFGVLLFGSPKLLSATLPSRQRQQQQYDAIPFHNQQKGGRIDNDSIITAMTATVFSPIESNQNFTPSFNNPKFDAYSHSQYPSQINNITTPSPSATMTDSTQLTMRKNQLISFFKQHSPNKFPNVEAHVDGLFDKYSLANIEKVIREKYGIVPDNWVPGMTI